jgi:hypothetical protein
MEKLDAMTVMSTSTEVLRQHLRMYENETPIPVILGGI